MSVDPLDAGVTPVEDAPAAPAESPDATSEQQQTDPRIQKANKEAQRYRQQLRDTEAELERTRSATEKAVRMVQTQTLRAEAVTVASELGIVDPAAAVKLVSDSIEFDDDGYPANLREQFERLGEEKPYLVAGKAKPRSATAGAVPGTGSPLMPEAPAETTKQKRTRLNGGGSSRDMLIYENAVRRVPGMDESREGGVFYGGRDVTKRMTPEESRRFLESQRGRGGAD